MLDNPEKTTRLLAALKTALPFEAEILSKFVNLGPAALRRVLLGVALQPRIGAAQQAAA